MTRGEQEGWRERRPDPLDDVEEADDVQPLPRAKSFVPRGAHFERSALPVIDVTAPPFSARGDGESDDTDAIQAAIDAAPDGSTLYFPPGVYPVGRPGVVISVERRRCLMLLAHGCAVLKRRVEGLRTTQFTEDSAENFPPFEHDDVQGILEFVDCEGITIRGLAFDGNGFEPIDPESGRHGFPLVSFVGCERVRVEQNRWFDSSPRLAVLLRAVLCLPPLELVHMGLGFDHAPVLEPDEGPANRHVSITGNDFQYLGVRVRHAAHVRISGNRFRRAVPFAVSLGGRANFSTLRDVRVYENRILSPAAVGIMGLDWNEGELSLRPSGTRMSRIRITDNEIVQQEEEFPFVVGPAGNFRGAIFFGILPVFDAVPGDARSPLYRDLRIERNRIRLLRAGPGAGKGVWVHLGDAGVTQFRQLVVSNNKFHADGGTAIQLTSISRSCISGNLATGVRSGIELRKPRRCFVHDNSVEWSGLDFDDGFRLDDSAGANVLADNVDQDRPSGAAWEIDVVEGSDRFRNDSRQDRD
jgi:hypothetical protein